MKLLEVSRGAVSCAISEFEQTGRAAFLERYGIGKAISYFVEYNGNLYDSKAIVGAAAGFDAPGSKPLTAADFSGGEQTAAALLRSRLNQSGECPIF